MLAVNAIDVFYGESRVLTRLNLEVGDGEVACVMGRNGVGKTTLLKAIMGLLPPRRGTIVFDGRDITRLAPYDRALLGISYAPQGREIFPSLTVWENLALGARRARPTKDSLEYVLSLFPALSQMLGKRGGDLSGGQQQQLAIARALISDPTLLLLDEPTEGIQPSIVQEIAAVLHRIRREGRRAILLVEQYLEFARGLSDHFYVLDRGAVALESKREELETDKVKRLLSV
jgi:urea transport system ATP-binding protein